MMSTSRSSPPRASTSGAEAKVVTGVDDHSRFCVIAKVAQRAAGRAVCLAFAEALQRFGILEEVLTDNGKQFTGRFNRPRPAEVLFERICRENGIVARNAKPRTPTTTGKVERFHIVSAMLLRRCNENCSTTWRSGPTWRPCGLLWTPSAPSTTPTGPTSP